MNRLITYIRQFFVTTKKVSDWSLANQHSAYNSQNIESCSVELTVMFDNGYQTVCDNRNTDLYSHRILSIRHAPFLLAINYITINCKERLSFSLDTSDNNILIIKT